MAEQSLPIRDAPPAAGGGRPSKTVELRSDSALSPPLREHLSGIYEAIKDKKRVPGYEEHGPSFTSLTEFEDWFKSPAASAVAPPPEHDLSYPISNYYISSSHNTYLSGNQLYGTSTGDAYENVLKRGCRCLEIDVWDGHDDDSSISSSDLEGDRNVRVDETQGAGRRKRANSRLSRLKEKVKEKAKSRSPRGHSPARSHELERTGDEMKRVVSKDDQGLLTAENLSSRQPLHHKYEPRVKHGYTLTKEVPFRTVCQAISDSAFYATDLPLIVSLEVHCTLEQQELMVQIVQDTLGSHLVDLSKVTESDINTLPSPDDLRKKILIKVKWVAADPETGESNNPLDHVDTTDTVSTETSVTSSEKKKKAAKILHTLSALGVYTRGYSFKHFDQPEAKIPTHVFSLSEAKVEDIHQDPRYGPALFEHNRNFLMRCYPSGIRVNSSNLEPCFLWRQGAQMVALNWQSLDKGMMLNEGMFSGEEGWVLKPEGFRGTSDKHTLDPKPYPERQLLDLEIELIAAQNLPVPVDREDAQPGKLKPYVKLQLHVDTHGPPGRGSVSGSKSNSHAHFASRYTQRHLSSHIEDDDDESRKLKRESKKRRSADPDFGHEIVRWNGIHDVVDELSFLRIKIHDDRPLAKDELVAWSCIKLSRLRNGYRFVHLLDAHGSPSPGILLVRILKTLH